MDLLTMVLTGFALLGVATAAAIVVVLLLQFGGLAWRARLPHRYRAEERIRDELLRQGYTEDEADDAVRGSREPGGQ